MNRYFHTIRQPVRRPRVETYLLLTLLSFALSVSLTRFFLAMTGYPQVGGGILHISHVLWGGLLLFIAAMLPLVLANRWVYRIAAILAGVGIGLFIDEVGKFITQSYDYFFPPAAPIIYAFFLICVLVYLQIAKPRPRNDRRELYKALEMMEEILEHDLDIREQDEIKSSLNFVIEHGESPELIRLAEDLSVYFRNEEIVLAPIPSGRLQNLESRLREIENKYLNRERLRKLIVIGLGILGLLSILIPSFSILSLLINPGAELFAGAFWYLGLQIVLIITGILLLWGIRLFMEGSEFKGLRISYFTLLIYLTMVNLFLFYYFQFSIILAAIYQFLLLLAVLHYQQSHQVDQIKTHQ